MRDLIAAGEIQIGKGEVLRALAPHLDTSKAVEVELQAGQRVVGLGTPPGLPVDDLPPTLHGGSEHRVDPARDGEPFEPQEEGPLREERNHAREPAGEERLAQAVHLPRLGRQLVRGEVGRVVQLEELTLTGGTALDPTVNL